MHFYKFCLTITGISFVASWNYKSAGPSTWGSSYPTCTGYNQSPINIDSSSAVQREDLTIEPTGYDSTISFSASNNGHGITFAIPTDEYGNLNIIAKDLYSMNENKWNLLQFHFHWGTEDVTGSENKLNGIQYPMEVHLVHQNTKYNSDHTNYTDGLLVIAFFFEVDSTLSAKAISDIVNAISIVERPGNTTTTTMKVIDLITSDWYRGTFYSWQGSLTTPGCSESVSWYLFEDTIKISPENMQYIRSHMYDEEGDVLDRNWRPVQAMGGRTLYTSGGSIICYTFPNTLVLATMILLKV